MLNPVSPWTATVQSDIENSAPLFELKLANYYIQLFNTGDSLWLTTIWPSSGSIAFRLAFGMNSFFEHAVVNEVKGGLLLTASTRLGNYRINISFPESNETIFRYTTTFQALFPMLIPFWPRDIVPLTKEGRVENTAGKIHTHQVGGRSGQLFFSMTKPENGSVFYFQNLTAMSQYSQDSETSVQDTVGGEWPEIGFQFPVNAEKPIPPDIEYIISDAFVVMSENIPEKDNDITAQFLNYIAAVYVLLPKPEPQYPDWPDIANKVLTDLSFNKGSWLQADGMSYLNAYVCDYKTPPEIMVQLAVMLPMLEYLEWKGEKSKLFDSLNEGLKAFFDENIQSIVRWHPSLKDNLDKSEEQKQEMVMDSWYLHHPLLNLSRLALKGDKVAEKLFLTSVEFAIKVAHEFDYEWPVFYKMTTLEIIKSETSPGKGGEKDVAGSYAHVMLMAYKLTKEKRFLTEAKKGISHLDGLGFDIFYQANNTAFAAGALIELYTETNDNRFLELSYCCLAGIFKNVKLWDCNYGYGKDFPNFFSVYPLNDAPYTAAYEELEVYAALHHYLKAADGIDILPSLKILIPEFIKYTTSRLAHYYPAMLPQDMIAEKARTGEIKKDLWIPLEDIYDGWEKSGQVGQEIYGAGLPFAIIPRQYFAIKDLNALGFIDYPTSNFRYGKKSLTFHTIGNPDLKACLIISGMTKKTALQIKVEMKTKSAYKEIKAVEKSNKKYEISGDAIIRITW
jgi:hypothetical protein